VSARWRHGQIPVALSEWLLDPDSLTDRLRRACPGCFAVRVIDEGWQRPRLDEVRSLDMPVSAVAWIRQVQLLCDDRPWVFARSVIPSTTLTGQQRQLAFLGNRPLGAYLFSNPGLQRGAVEVARIQQDHAMFAEATGGLSRRPAEIWGRRSVFRVGGKPLLVAEVFLPGIKRAP